VSRPEGSGEPQGGAPATSSYYGRPVLKQPVWTDEIPAYYFVGGLAGASASLALGARLTGNDRLARSALTAAAVGVTAGLPLLVDDLGRPERFHHMLRMLKPTSPMSVGTWLLAGLGPAAVAAAACDRLGVLPRVGRLAEAVAGILGPAVSTYTAVLVANTAVPVWHEAGRELPTVFAAGAAASAGGAAAVLTPPAAAGPARRLAVGGALVELAAVEVMRRRLGELAEPYDHHPARRHARLARACTAGGALLLGALGRRRPAAVAGGLLTMAGSAFQRFAVHKAGFGSAADPRYVVGPQRERLAAR
jgi:Polysulphide reductase, NrfD